VKESGWRGGRKARREGGGTVESLKRIEAFLRRAFLKGGGGSLREERGLEKGGVLSEGRVTF